MNRKVLAFLAFLSLALISLGAPAQQNGYIHVVSHLERFQTATGGFSLVEGGKPSLEATSHALFISSLFGLRAKINQQEVARFIQTLENGDYGYGKSAGSPSDLESVRHAVLSYQHLGLAVPNAGNVASYIKSLYDAQTNLFASRAGEKGDLKSTALAFQALEYLGELQRQWVQDIFEKVRVYLSKHVQLAENAHFAFDEKTLTTTSANYYGVVLGSYVGFDFVSLPKWAAFVAQLQNAEGGFATGLDRRTATVESTLHAVSTLRLLQQTKGNDDQFVTLVKSDALVNYLLNIPRDLRSAAQAHLAVAFTNAFSRNFETRVFYELLRATGSAEKKVVQGTQLKPVVSVKTFDGFAHPGLDIEATITFEDARDALKTKLQLKDGEHYASNDFFDTTNHLGGLRIHYTVRCYVVGVGELSFELEDNKKIGYGVAVDARATLAVTGQQFAQGETVAVGTDFTFGVALHNQTQKDLLSGDFRVVFSVLDSSLVPIHVERVDGQTNAKPLNFHYTLKSTNLPSGDLVFRFEVISDAGVVHTTEYVSYQLSVPMIATQIAFDGVAEGAAPTYKIGDTVRVSIEPASFPDLRAVAAYPLKDITGNNTAPQRRFVMDVHSQKGALLRTVAGKAQTTEASAKYVFEVPITATLDSIGVNVISFRYIPSSGRSIDVASFDSRLGEVIEDAASLNYTVNANLQVVDVKEQPEGTTFAYGQVVPFRFRVQDSLSGLHVSKGDSDQANVYLTLKHADEAKGKPFVSALEAATEVVSATGDKEFVIQWAINPNAVQGNGVLSLVVQDADGNVVDIFDAKTKKPLSLDVTVGGDIQVEHSSYSTSDAATFRESAFVVQVGLTCQNQTLKNAQLRASVFRDDQLVASFLPVAVNDSGVYSVSWGGRHEAFPSGVYTVKFYREVDRKRAVDAHEFQEKKKKREEQLKQIEEGSEAAPAEEVAEELVVENIVTPLFEVSHSHSAPSTSKLPIRAEVLLAFLLGGAFLAISYQKKHYLAAK